ncbi:MAG: hypothetical protein WB422_10820, partial [Pseudolabrys sp.]
WLNQEIGRFDERLEAEQPQPCKFHTLGPRGSLLATDNVPDLIFLVMRRGARRTFASSILH